MIIKEIESITELNGFYRCNIKIKRWSINFTDKTKMVVKGIIPFEIADSAGMMAQIFKNGKSKTVLFGRPENGSSIALRDCYEWSKILGFERYPKAWAEKCHLKPGGRILDERKPGKPVALSVTNKGDILSPLFY